MKGKTNMSGVDESVSGKYPAIPAGNYIVQIKRVKDQTTKNGDPMVSIGLVVAVGPYEKRWIWDNIVIPVPDSPAIKILGRTKHFLHCIGEPYEGEIEYDSDRWLDKECEVIVDIEPANDYHKEAKNIIAEYVTVEAIDRNEAPF